MNLPRPGSPWAGFFAIRNCVRTILQRSPAHESGKPCDASADDDEVRGGAAVNLLLAGLAAKLRAPSPSNVL